MRTRTSTAPDDAKRVTMQVSTVGIVCNAALTVFKLVAGIVAHSSAIVADAVHSASDILGSLIVMIGAVFSHKAADASHPYGHEKLECIASILLGNILVLVGAAIGYAGVMKIVRGETLAAPGVLALIAAVVSIGVKEGLYWYTIAAAKRIRSVSLKAEAWHHRSDALSSIGSFAGVLGARLGVPILDPIASIVICLFIFKVAYGIFHESIDRLTRVAACKPTGRATRTPLPPCARRCSAPPASCAWTISRRGCSAAERMSMPRSRSTARCRCGTRTSSPRPCTTSSSATTRTSSTAPCTSTRRDAGGEREKTCEGPPERAALFARAADDRMSFSSRGKRGKSALRTCQERAKKPLRNILRPFCRHEIVHPRGFDTGGDEWFT